MAKITAAERNRRKRERRKQAKKAAATPLQPPSNSIDDETIEIEYIAAAPLSFHPQDAGNNNTVKQEDQDVSSADPGGSGGGGDQEDSIEAVLKRFHERSSIAVREDEQEVVKDEDEDDGEKEDLEEGGGGEALSRRKWRKLNRPTVGELKQRVKRPDLVEAHDVTSPDPDFLILLKGVSGTVPVPRHWGRKRKYLQGKRGIEKPPFKLPDFIAKTGIMDIRGAMQEDQAKMSLKQKQRSRVAPKSGGEVDYRTLHDAFFKYQTKPPLTKFGDLYYEGKEFEQDTSKFKPGVMSDKLRAALGMTDPTAPPPFLMNMQRYGPPPAFPNLKIPGLNSPLPPGASYGSYRTHLFLWFCLSLINFLNRIS